MMHTTPQTDPDTMTISEKLAEIAGFKDYAVKTVKRLAILMRSLRKDGAKNIPNSTHAVLKFYQEIANETLNPEAAILLKNASMIKAVMHLPHDQQLAVARGQEIAVAVIQSSGQMANENLPIQRMGPDLLKRVFSEHGIRSLKGQSAIIRENGKTERHGMVTVLQDEVMLKIGNQKITPEELRGPLMALGYSLELSRNSDRKAG